MQKSLPQTPKLIAWHRSKRIAMVAVGLVAALTIAGCGGGGDSDDATLVDIEPTAVPTPDPTSTPEPTATAEPIATATPTPTPGPVSPLNGLPVDKASVTRLLTVKIDNHRRARPQSGIQNADMMIEIWVEGITRFLSVWQESEAELIGPIRSMRPTDFAIQRSWDSTFVNSGGQGWVQAIGNASTSQYFVEPRGTFRVGFRSAPHNLYGDTTAFRDLDSRGDYDEPLEPLWNFGEMPSDAADATEIRTNWRGGYTVDWSWNGTGYERTTEGAAHDYLDENSEAQRIIADTLVMFEVGIYQASGGSGSSVPASETTGNGAAWVFANGQMQQGTWARESETDWFTVTAEDGTDLTVPPGRLWLILVPTGGVVPS